MRFPPQPCWIFQHVGSTISARTMPALFPWYSKGEQSGIVGFQDGPSNFIMSAPVVFNGSMPKYLSNTFLIMCNGRSLRSSSIPYLKYIESWRSNHGCVQKCMSCIVYIVLVWILYTKRESKRLINDEQLHHSVTISLIVVAKVVKTTACDTSWTRMIRTSWEDSITKLPKGDGFSFLAFAKPFAHVCR